MNSFSLRRFINNDVYMNNANIKILSCDELMIISMSYPFLCIVNTDERYLPGKHWICIYIDENKYCIFWDSLGLPPHSYKKYFMQFIDRYCEGYCYLNEPLQAKNTQTCGLYCLYFLYYICRHENVNSILYNLNNTQLNETIIRKFYDMYLTI